MKNLSSLSETTRTCQYRIADVAFFPAGTQQVLAYAKDTEVTRILDQEVANLLIQCREFKTLDEHAHAYCRERQLSATTLQTMRYEPQHLLQYLARDGYLISSSQIRDLFQGSSEEVSPSPLTSIVFPTCDRVEGSLHCMTSYIEHCRHFGRTLDFVVADDSKTSATRDAYRQMLCTLKTRYGVNIAYAGFEEKMAFVKKLSKVGDIPEEIVFWACIGDKQCGPRTVGANRNVLLLHTIGERIFTTDDDMICRIAPSPGIREGLALNSREDAAEFWFYPDRSSALESVQFVEQDIFALHEQWLGRDPKAGIANYSRSGQLSLEEAEADFLHRLSSQPSTIATTQHGFMGDVSEETTEFLLLKGGETFKRSTSSEQAYRSANASREIAQVVDQITIAAYPVMFLGGLDNREFLPPFPPSGRAEDTAFGFMLTKCFPNTYTVHLPWVLIHAPLGARSYSEPSFDIPFYQWIPTCISLFDPGFASTATDRLSKLAQFLNEIGCLPTASFTKFARHYLWLSRGRQLSRGEKQLRSSQELLSPFWRLDAEAYWERMRQSMSLPVEQLLRGGPDMAQRSLVQLAQILKWWPVMVETAKRLRAEGSRLAQPT